MLKCTKCDFVAKHLKVSGYKDCLISNTIELLTCHIIILLLVLFHQAQMASVQELFYHYS